MSFTSFLGFSCPNLPFIFLNVSFLGTCYIFLREYWDSLWVFYLLFFSLPYFGLACDHGSSFLCLEEKERKCTG